MAGIAVRQQLERHLPSSCYEICFRLLCQMHHRLLSPYSFREKMKYLFRDTHLLLTRLNPLLPDEYQLSDHELQLQQQEDRDYRDLNKLEGSIQFLNQLTSKAVRSSQNLGNFYELVKSHKRKEIDDAKFYGSAYKLLRRDIGMMKKLENIMGDPTTPSYIKVPMEGTSSSSDDMDRHVLNNTCRIYKKSRKRNQIDQDPNYYIYQVDKVIARSRGRPRPDGTTAEERKKDAVSWWESRRCDLDLVLQMLKVAEEHLHGALRKIMRGKWIENVGLREYLVENGVKVRLVEQMFGKLENLMINPHGSLRDVVEELRRKEEEVVEAIHQLDQKYTEINNN